MDARTIRETPSASFYEGINNLKGVDMVTSGLTYKQINTHGRVQAFQLYTNAPDVVSSQGATLGLNYRTTGGYQLGANGTWSSFDIRNADPNNVAAFNTPSPAVGGLYYVSLTFDPGLYR